MGREVTPAVVALDLRGHQGDDLGTQRVLSLGQHDGWMMEGLLALLVASSVLFHVARVFGSWGSEQRKRVNQGHHRSVNRCHNRGRTRAPFIRRAVVIMKMHLWLSSLDYYKSEECCRCLECWVLCATSLEVGTL